MKTCRRKEKESEKRKKCSFWEPEFPLFKAMGVLMKFRVLQLQGERVIKRGENRDHQQQLERETDRGQERRRERLIQAIAVQLGRGLGGLGRPGGDLQLAPCWLCVCVCVCVLCVCVFGLTATVTENAWCAEAHAGSHEVFNRTKQMHLFSQLEEFANVHIRG